MKAQHNRYNRYQKAYYIARQYVNKSRAQAISTGLYML